MTPESLFLARIDDLRGLIAEPDGYAMLKASAIVRQLFLDGQGLYSNACPRGEFKLVFRVVDGWSSPYTKLVLEDGATFYATLDGVDPETALRPGNVVELKRDAFLKFNLIYANGTYFNVHDVIMHCANVLGGVHFGKPKDGKQEQLHGASSSILFNGSPVSPRQLLPVVRVIERAVAPLYKHLKS